MEKFKLRLAVLMSLMTSLFIGVPVCAAEADGVNIEAEESTETSIEEVAESTEISVEEAEVLAATTNGWVENSDGTWSYYENGTMAKSKILCIGGLYYGFDYTGVMYENTLFQGINQYADQYVSYHYAKADGSLLVNSWYEDSYGEWYYFGEAGSGHNGTKKINNVLYFFSGGHMLTDTVVGYEYCPYYVSDLGVATPINANGWTQIGNEWFYARGGQPVSNKVVLINGSYYAFGGDGHMLSNEAASVYVYFSDYGSNMYTVCAKADGTLYTNSWYQDAYGNWYYCREDGTVPRGLCTINGKQYYFDTYDGYMYTNRSFTLNKVSYYADEDGVVTEIKNNTWIKVNGMWRYYRDGAYLKSGIYQIGSESYYFDYNGNMVSNYRFSYNVSGVGSRYFYAKSSGALAKNEWVYSDGEWYYFDANGYGLSGEKTIDGKTYYFSSGRMMTNYAVSNRLYGADGVKVEGKTGWYLLDGEWYYFKSSGVLYYGMLTLNGNKYYLNPSLYQNSNYFVVSGILYQAKDKNGVLTTITKDGWYEDGSYTYYVKDGKVFNNGWVTSGTSKYYIAGNHMVCNNYHYNISGSYYAFDATGKMFTNTWLKYNSSYVYASSTGALVTGKQVIGGVTYEFNTDGTLKDSFSVSGAVITECTDYGTKTYTLKAGWNEINGVWYYVFNGAVVKGTTMNIGGFTYRFDSMGMMYKNVVYGGCYYDANGAMKKNCWIEHNGKWMYAQEDGRLASYGVYEIGGKEYLFIDYYMVEEDFVYGSYIYTLNSDDSIKSRTYTSGDGWCYVNNIPYMIVDGNFYTGWINDAYFERGRKVYNSLLTKNSTYGKDTYYCIENGSLVRNAWCNDDSSYAKADGTLACDEWINLGGTWYYLDDIYYVTGLREIDGVTYYFDKYGRLSKTYTTISDGWHQLDTGWYYGRDGVFVKNEHVYIGGYWYFFDYNGRMQDYYGLTDGRECSMGWHKVTVQKTTDGYYKFPDEAQTVTGWIYVNIEGNLVTGWQNIGGVTYYFDDGIMVTGAKYINGDLHRFADSGAYIGKVATKDGWYYDGKNYFYICNYLVYYNRIEIIDGVRYGFDSEGVMVTNAAFSPYSSYDSYDFYYFGSSGAQVTKEGVYTDKYGDTVYVDGNGHAYTGYVYISGKFVGMTKQKNLDIY